MRTTHATAQQTGTRSAQCDATAVTAGPNGLTAYVVVDGIGSSAAVRAFARSAARRLARAAVRQGSAEVGLRQISAEIAAETSADPFDEQLAACAVVALVAPGRPVELAWRGDVRAYAIRDGRAERLTDDHNMRRVREAAGLDVLPGDRNRVTSYLGSLEPEVDVEDLYGHAAIETASVAAEGLRLLLATDGAYEPHEDLGEPLADLLAADSPADAAAEITEAAVISAGFLGARADNATALVVDLTA